jgi:hypothetical protein
MYTRCCGRPKNGQSGARWAFGRGSCGVKCFEMAAHARRTARSAILGAFILLAGSGCSDHKIREEEPEAGPKCGEEIRALGWEERSALGFSAAETLAAMDTPLRSTALFFDENLRRDLSLNLRGAGTVREAGPVVPACAARLEIDVEATWQTDDGAFDETFAVTLMARGVQDWNVTKPLSLLTLTGSYSTKFLPYDYPVIEKSPAVLYARVDEGGFSGSLHLSLANSRTHWLAEWPVPTY